MLQTWQYSVVFLLGSSNAMAQSFGSTSMIVFGTLPFAEGYFLTKSVTWRLWFGFLQRCLSFKRRSRNNECRLVQKYYNTKRRGRWCIQTIFQFWLIEDVGTILGGLPSPIPPPSLQTILAIENCLSEIFGWKRGLIIIGINLRPLQVTSRRVTNTPSWYR